MFRSQNSYKKLKKSDRAEELETLSTVDLYGGLCLKGRGNLSLLFFPLPTLILCLCLVLPFLKGSPLSGTRFLVSLLNDPVKLASVEYNGRYFDKTAKSQGFCAISTLPAGTVCPVNLTK